MKMRDNIFTKAAKMQKALDEKLGKISEFEALMEKADSVSAAEGVFETARGEYGSSWRTESAAIAANSDERIPIGVTSSVAMGKKAPSSLAEFSQNLTEIADPDVRAGYYSAFSCKFGLGGRMRPDDDPAAPVSLSAFTSQFNGIDDPVERSKFYNKHGRRFGL